MKSRAFVALAVIVVLFAAVVVYFRSGYFHRAQFVGDRGPLSLQNSGGLTSMKAPRGGGEWYGTMGAMLPCVRDSGGENILITGVRFVTRPPEPLAVRADFRTIPPRDQRPVNTPSAGWDPVTKVGGARPGFGDARWARGERVQGEFTTGFPIEVTLPCDVVNEGEWNALTEMLIEMKASPRGAYLRELYVDYEIGSKRYSLLMPMSLVLCGSELQNYTEACEGSHQW